MVIMKLVIRAELENLTNLQPEGGCDEPNFTYYFKLHCENCGEVSQKRTCVSLNERVPHPNGKGTINLVQKCKFCERKGTVLMIPGHGRPLTLHASQRGMHSPLMLFDCRGLNPVEFAFGNAWWKAQSVSSCVSLFVFLLKL
ncbi:PREDICTED: UPF0587 protein C1orf123 homolog [Nelumbo nucifera]|uniref:UPF0587 protein C1orf123 homolog n=2 Tax=Nelumbo nucifera TaxID=4432 RepID=A0A1U8AIQ2_NELNU|nr:PREDICTED: UPF0587 protein C1orf123 homolog [Nelumbo nucifera]DAD48912.1 TPA_asm: hypothetical protein HUJ06_018849 [Nelumbo nucifera]